MRELMSKVEQSKLALNVGRTARLMADGLSNAEIARKLNKPESSVRQWINIINEANKNRGLMK